MFGMARICRSRSAICAWDSLPVPSTVRHRRPSSTYRALSASDSPSEGGAANAARGSLAAGAGINVAVSFAWAPGFDLPGGAGAIFAPGLGAGAVLAPVAGAGVALALGAGAAFLFAAGVGAGIVF